MIWTTVVDKSGNGKVLLESHENYKGINGVDELIKYEEYAPGARDALGEMIKKSRNSRKQQVVIKRPRKREEIETYEQRIEKRFEQFIFEKGDIAQ